jgi:DNA-binding transcriptional LysR family regulator
VRTPCLLVSSAIVAGTDMIATVSERIAREFAQMLSLQVLKVPIPIADSNILMIWHERTHRDAAHRLLRQATREVSKGFGVT